MCAAISNKVAENLGNQQEYYLVTRALGPQPSTTDVQISIQDYASLNPEGRFQILVFATFDEEADKIGIYQSLEKLLVGLEYLPVNVTMYVVDATQRDAIKEYWELNDTTTLEYLEMTTEFFSVELPFEYGKIGITQEQFFDKICSIL